MSDKQQYENIKRAKIIQAEYKKMLLKVNPELDDESGIYFLTRLQPEIYVGQAGGIRTDEKGNKVYVKQGLLTRLAQHFTGYEQHIDRSLKKHKLYSEDNPYGYKVNFLHFKPEELNEKEQYYIKAYQDAGYTLKNATAGGQGEGKIKINDYKPAKGYHDGVKQGRKMMAKELKHIIDKHLNITLKNPNKISQKAYEKFIKLLEEAT